MRIVFAVKTDSTDAAITEDAKTMADSSYRYAAVETGDVVVFQRVSEAVRNSAVTALILALSLGFAFLTIVYYALERRPILEFVTLSPIVATVLFLVATMRFFGIPFNTLTATIPSITPILVQFGPLITFSVTYSFLASTVVLPVVLILWTRVDLVRGSDHSDGTDDEPASARTKARRSTVNKRYVSYF